VYLLPAPPEGTVADTNLIDELHLTVRVPDDLPEEKRAAIRRTLADNEFLDRLLHVVRDVFRERPELGVAAVTMSR
jgi:hypothetical protein